MSEPIKVMIVDDHTLFRQGLRKVLESFEEIQVIGEASDGKEAIVKVDELHPDIVLMDIKMPRMDGFESTRLIRQRYPELIIIALTMYEDADYVLKMVNAGANGYMHKDASADKLVDAIKQVHEGDIRFAWFVDPKILPKEWKEMLPRGEKKQSYKLKLVLQEVEPLVGGAPWG